MKFLFTKKNIVIQLLRSNVNDPKFKFLVKQLDQELVKSVDYR